MGRVPIVAGLLGASAVAAGLLAMAPAASSGAAGHLPKAAEQLIPFGSTLVVAQQMDATFGVVSYRTRAGQAP